MSDWIQLFSLKTNWINVKIKKIKKNAPEGCLNLLCTLDHCLVDVGDLCKLLDQVRLQNRLNLQRITEWSVDRRSSFRSISVQTRIMSFDHCNACSWTLVTLHSLEIESHCVEIEPSLQTVLFYSLQPAKMELRMWKMYTGIYKVRWLIDADQVPNLDMFITHRQFC